MGVEEDDGQEFPNRKKTMKQRNDKKKNEKNKKGEGAEPDDANWRNLLSLSAKRQYKEDKSKI